MKKKLEVKCPKCKKKFNYYDSEFRPFCSERCKMVDLGKWLSDEYSVKGESVEIETKNLGDDDENYE